MNTFNSHEEILSWYESQERVINENFLNTIPWHEAGEHQLDPAFIPIILYMRDVEAFTDIYYQQLLASPTGKHPIIRRFMDRWAHEEPLHAQLLNRFLESLDLPIEKDWKERAFASIDRKHLACMKIKNRISHAFGKDFTSVHMTWGAINEHSTLIGYRRLKSLANHPVLSQILQGIIREEARHAFFYWAIARLELEQSKWRRILTRTIIDKLWLPVGLGEKPEHETNFVIRTLFGGEVGFNVWNTYVNGRIAQLPGFEGFETVSTSVKNVTGEGQSRQ